MKWIKVDQLIFDNTKKTPLNFHIYFKKFNHKKKAKLDSKTRQLGQNFMELY